MLLKLAYIIPQQCQQRGSNPCQQHSKYLRRSPNTSTKIIMSQFVARASLLAAQLSKVGIKSFGLDLKSSSFWPRSWIFSHCCRWSMFWVPAPPGSLAWSFSVGALTFIQGGKSSNGIFYWSYGNFLRYSWSSFWFCQLRLRTRSYKKNFSATLRWIRPIKLANKVTWHFLANEMT